MSYYPSGGYQQPPPAPGYDQYSQYQQSPPGQNGGAGYSEQYAPPQQHQYGGSSTYDQYQGGGSGGGPVQQPQGGYNDGHQSAYNASYGTAYGAGQHYQPPTYNPQSYAAHSAPLPPIPQQPQTPSYNPQTYAPSPNAQYAQQYNPASYQPSSNTYGYAQTGASFPSGSFSPTQSAYPQSPPSVQGAFNSHQYVPQRRNSQYTYQQLPSPPQSQQPSYGFSPSSSTTARPHIPPYPTNSYSSFPQGTDSIRVPSSQHTSISPALPGLSDETWMPSPPQYDVNGQRGSPSPLYPSTSHGSLPSPPSTTPGPTPPAHGPVSRSNTLDRHPSLRPLPGPPEPTDEHDYFHGRTSSQTLLTTHEEDESLSQEDLFSQVEDAIMNAGRRLSSSAHSPSISVSQAPLYMPGSPQSSRAAHNGTAANGHLSPAYPQQYSDDSDAEGTQGAAMLYAAEEDERRRRSGSNHMSRGSYGSQRTRQDHHSDSDDYGAVDMTSFGGGYDVQMSYGGDPSQLAAVGGAEIGGETYSQTVSSRPSSTRRSHASQSSHVSRGDYDYRMDSIHPFPPFNPAARVDASGTGGLSEPTGNPRRQSYDEGDEYALMEGQLPERFPDEPPDIFHQAAHTSFSSSRPLPPPPTSDMPPLQTDVQGTTGDFPHAPDAYSYNAQGQIVPRSSSLVENRGPPQVIQPLRSKTDAEERRIKQQQGRSSVYSGFDSTPASSVVPDLPSIGVKRFVPSKLGAPDYKKCEKPWALSSILKWLFAVVSPEQYTELREVEVREALVNLFTNKVPTMNIADAEGLSNRVVQDMFQAGALVPTEEWVKLSPAPMTGVIFQLTGAGCYAPTLHDHIVPGRCYARHCQRTLKKVNLQNQPTRSTESWAEFYHLKKEDIEGKDKKELERQNVLHEIVQTEDTYMEQLSVLQSLYRDSLLRTEPSIISPKRRDKFVRDVFSRVDAIKQANEEHLLPQLKYRQQEQGPWIVGFSDIFRQWIRKAKAAYLEYAGGFPGANFMMRQEIDRNLDFRSFIERASKDKRSSRLGWDTYLKSPITRLQRYTLLLQTVMKNMKDDSEEKKNLQIAYDEVKNVTLECDARVAEMQRKVDLSDLGLKLVLRQGMQSVVELNLDHFGRGLIHRGELQRMGGNRFTWLDTHALLFDHYLVIAKTIVQRTDQGGKIEKYDVSRLPIPMDLLILESANDPAVQKSSYVKGITSVTTVSGRTPTPSDGAVLGRTPSSQAMSPGLQHINTGSSTNSLQTVTSLSDVRDSEKIMYPFKIKHLGREIYTLFAPTEQARREWCTKITEAKTKHAAALHAQNAEPFRLRVMADSAFVYDAFAVGSNKSAVITGTPVDRAIKEVEQKFKDKGRPGPICRARVNCATSFTTPYPGKQLIAVGTDFGVYLSEMGNSRGWWKAIAMSRVTQIAVLEEFNLFLLISDKVLIAYHLDVICSNERTGGTSAGAGDSSRKAPQKLSGSKDVGFFSHGRMKDRTLVFYKKKDGLNSVFKVLEPIYQKSTEKKRGIFKRGATEFFREYDEFYIPAECVGMDIFHSSLAVSTARGFEVLTLDKKQPWSVPNLEFSHVQNIASHIREQRALAMLRLSDQEFLLCYSNCAVYVNKHGEVSRSVIMDFVGSAQTAALYDRYLLLFDNDFVEIRDAENGRLKQIIAGREIKCLDEGGNVPLSGSSPVGQANGASAAEARTVKFVMQHPELDRTQIVVELVLNENMKA